MLLLYVVGLLFSLFIGAAYLDLAERERQRQLRKRRELDRRRRMKAWRGGV